MNVQYCPACNSTLYTDSRLDGTFLKCSDPGCKYNKLIGATNPPPPPGKEADPVNHPSHYTQGSIECIDALKAELTPEEFRGFLKGNAAKYIWRSNLKGSTLQDIEKAQWYINKLVEILKEH